MQRQLWAAMIGVCGCYGGTNDPDAAMALGSTGAAEDASSGDNARNPQSADGTTDGSGSAEPGTGATTGDVPVGSTGGDTTNPGTDDGSTGEPLQGCAALPQALLCEDFDDGIDADLWQVQESNGGTVVAEDGMMHVQLQPMDGAHGFIKLIPQGLFPLQDNRVFGRVRMLIEPSAPDRHSYILNTWGQLDGATARYRLDVNGGRLNSRYTHEPTVAQHGGWRKLGRDAPAAVWTCLEWEFDGSTNSMRYWFDGELDGDMEVDGAVEDPPWVAPPFDNFEIGYHTFQAPEADNAFDFWFDDLVLAADRIGC